MAFAALAVGLAGISGRNAKIKITQSFKNLAQDKRLALHTR
jgi:hypothetical protein